MGRFENQTYGQTKSPTSKALNSQIQLIKALYGLRQAPRAWNIKLENTLKSLNFKKCAREQAIYTKASKDSLLLVGVYVDDLIITGTPKKEIDKFKAQMEEKFKMSDLRLLAYYLGIESTQKQATVALSSCDSEFIAATAAATQALYLKRLLSRLTHTEEEKITIMVDNKSAIALMKNLVFHRRSKYIDTNYHFIRECVERDDIQEEFVHKTDEEARVRNFSARFIMELAYVRYAKDETYVKVFESVLVGPINVGNYRFVFEVHCLTPRVPQMKCPRALLSTRKRKFNPNRSIHSIRAYSTGTSGQEINGS
nr:ribonuclease H-like domain, reverse transcriptase, RNA-dependent DNA polymerase [Tanacetum cinerariifolium]